MNSELKALTRESIETALTMLISKKDIKDITITEIAEKAGVSRAAFYRNYSSKEDVLKQYINRLLDDIDKKAWEEAERIGDYKGYWLVMFREWKKISETMRPLDPNIYFSEIQKRTNSNARRRVGEKGTWAAYREILFLGAMMNITREWLFSGAKESPEEMAEFCRQYLTVKEYK